MTERPILFSAPMVRALLDGSKTQTRRVAKLTDAGHVKEPRGHRRWHPADPDARLACPYGQPGDNLWVRETWAHGVHALAANRDQDGPFVYAATDNVQSRLGNKWKPGIHMFRYASRINLSVLNVRMERLQEVSKADALAEGISIHADFADRDDFYGPVAAYQSLWESINGHGSWDLNPWVSVIQFKRLKAATISLICNSCEANYS